MKNKLNYFVDVLLILSFLAVAKTGLILFFFFPEGVKQGGYQEFFGITKRDYGEIHDFAGIAFIILAVIHLILHWDWLWCMTKNLFNRKEMVAKNKE